jgi:hypothetical protein
MRYNVLLRWSLADYLRCCGVLRISWLDYQMCYSAVLFNEFVLCIPRRCVHDQEIPFP